jgi:hypothetical protein
MRLGMPKGDGFRSWSEDDIAAFEAIYPVAQGPVRPGASVALLADVVRVGGAMSGVDRGWPRGQRFGSKMYRRQVRAQQLC